VKEQAEEMKESIEKLEKEKAVHQILMEHRHPNIVYGILCIPEGLFMHRQEMTLDYRIENSLMSAVSPTRQERWIQQIASALAWIEDLGYAHGDLRPANIFLSAMEDVRLGDFDATVKKGEQLLVASEPFCKLDENYDTPLAGPLSEQFSLASCIFTIRFGHIPFHTVKPHVRVRNLIMGLFPSTSSDVVFGDLMDKCWRGYYNSIRAVENDIISLLGKRSVAEHFSDSDTKALDDFQVSTLLSECYEFLAKESR
jgi:serine/threonine protein kinase